MPFVFPRDKKKEFEIRDFASIDEIVRQAIEDVEEWDPCAGMEGVKYGKGVYLLPTRRTDPPMKRADPQKFLVLLCLSKGLNLSEVEKWLDHAFLKYTEEVYFDNSNCTDIDERKVYYHTPHGTMRRSGPSTNITWHAFDEGYKALTKKD